jgi:hypothetical protein
LINDDFYFGFLIDRFGNGTHLRNRVVAADATRDESLYRH